MIVVMPTAWKSVFRNPFRRVVEGVNGNLRIKLALMIVVAAIAPMVTVAIVSIQSASDAITEQAQSTALAENESAIAEIENYLSRFPADLLTISTSPPIQGALRSLDNSGIDPVGAVPFDTWMDRLPDMFKSSISHKRSYEQLRYFDKFGNETISFTFKDGDPIVHAGTAGLESEYDQAFFAETMVLERGSVLVSDLSLKREGGVVAVPDAPILKFSTPVFDQSGAIRGIIVSDISASSLLVLFGQSDARQMYLITEEGLFAVHPDPSMLWGSDVDVDSSLAMEYSVQHEKLHEGSDKGSNGSVVFKNDERGQIVALGTVQFDRSNKTRHWIIGATTDTSAVLASVVNLIQIVTVAVIVVGIVAAILAFWWASDLAKRIGIVGAAIRQISSGNLTPEISSNSTDEIGKLTDSYQAMATYLKEFTEAASRIAGGDLTTVVKPTSDDDSLGNAFSMMVAGLRDAAEQREAALELEIENRELVRLNIVRNEFLSTVSHELRTPLTSLLAFGDILSRNRDGTLSDRQLEQLMLMRNNGWKLEALINDLLDVSQSEAGTFNIEKEDIDLAEIVRTTAASILSIFEEKQQTLSVVVDVDPARMQGDARRITQVLNNLLTNASKYSHDESVVEIRLSAAINGLEISVSDNGVGINKVDVPRLFTPFFRVNDEHSRRVGGTGLGLSIARTIAQLHGGNILVESTTGVGTVMRVHLPANEAQAAEPVRNALNKTDETDADDRVTFG